MIPGNYDTVIQKRRYKAYLMVQCMVNQVNFNCVNFNSVHYMQNLHVGYLHINTHINNANFANSCLPVCLHFLNMVKYQ